MTIHLTREQFSEAVAGQASEECRQHLWDCETCRADVTRFQDDLAIFGSTLRAWSQAAAEEPARIAAARAPRRIFPRFAIAGLATALLLIVFLLSTDVLHRSRYQPQHESSPMEDAALLTQVDAELARTVPVSMEPLTKLMASDQTAETKP